MQRCRLLPVLGLLVLAGCAPPGPPVASQYHPILSQAPITLAFAPGRERPYPDDAARLRALAVTLPTRVMPEFYATGPLAGARAHAIGDLLRRPVVLRPERAAPVAMMPGPDVAVLVLPVQSGIMADACRGPASSGVGDIWPGDDTRIPRMLPAGCPAATDIQAMVVNQSDLLYGRPLPPGAATPFGAAIERYYHRNDGPPPSQSTGQQQPAQETSPILGGIPAGLQNPLLGPLPATPSAGQTPQQGR